jgi:hypothetical protein
MRYVTVNRTCPKVASPMANTPAHSLKLRFGGDDDAGALVELAEQVEQQGAA